MGAAIAGALALPLLDKDDILEALFDSLGVGDVEWRSRLSRASDNVLRRLAMGSHGAVVVSWWRHPLSHVASGTSPSWLHSLPGEVVEVYCRCDPRVAARRFLARPRHVCHLDEQGGAFERFVWPGPLGIGRVVELDTDRAIDIEALVKELAPPGG